MRDKEIKMQNLNVSQTALNTIIKSEKQHGAKRSNHQGRDDRATTEQVLDPRTRLILFKLLSNGFLNAIDGCLSTGKEANVYYGKRDFTSSGTINSTKGKKDEKIEQHTEIDSGIENDPHMVSSQVIKKNNNHQKGFKNMKTIEKVTKNRKSSQNLKP